MAIFNLPTSIRLQMISRRLIARRNPLPAWRTALLHRPSTLLSLGYSHPRGHATVPIGDNDKPSEDGQTGDKPPTPAVQDLPLPSPDEIITMAREVIGARSRATAKEKQAVLQNISTHLGNLQQKSRKRRNLIRGLRDAIGTGRRDPILSIKKVLPSPEKVSPPKEEAAQPAPAHPESILSEADGVTLDHVQEHMSLPTGEDYPNAPATFRQALDARNVRLLSTFITDLASQNTPPVAIETHTQVVEKSIKIWAMTIRFDAHTAREQLAMGLGANKSDAQRAAWLALLSKLHTAGILADIIPQQAVETLMPQPVQYPGAPKRLFTPDLIHDEMQRMFKARKLNVQINGEYTSQRPGVHDFTLRLDIPGIADATTTGSGPRRNVARQAAWVAMLNRLHMHGALQQLFPPPEQPVKDPSEDSSDSQVYIRDEEPKDIELVELDRQVMKRERDAKLDIYNYAAKYGLIPHLSTKSVQHATRRSRRAKVSTKLVVQATIKLPEHGIEVVTRGKDSRTAETAAAIAFKRKVEEKHLSTDDVEATAVAPGYELLSTETASEFVEYFRSLSPGMSLEVETDHLYGVNHTRILIDASAVSEPGIMHVRKDSQALAFLLAAMAIAKTSPETLAKWAETRNSAAAQSQRSVRPFDVSVETDVLDLMRDTLISARRAGLPDQRESLSAEEISRETSRSQRRYLAATSRDKASAALQERLDRFRQDPRLETLRTTKAGLPMSTYTDQVVELVNQDVYSIVIGATGSGKTTQVPQILLEHAIENGKGGHCDIICTQPRRIAASSVAQRVAAERDEEIGKSVGYHVRGDARLPRPGGSITYCTTGILLEQLKYNADDIMDNVSHLVIDEVHERDIFVDFLLIILKKAVATRQRAGKKVPHIVLMSATLDQKLFSEYLPNVHEGKLVPCPSLSVPGRTFPVAERYVEQIVEDIFASHQDELTSLLAQDKGVSKEYLDGELRFAQDSAVGTPVIDWKRKNTGENDQDAQTAAEQKHEALVPVHLLTAVLAHICEQSTDGAVLAFLPGLQEITKAQDFLMQQPIFGIDFSDPAKFTILSLHSTVPQDQQRLIFEPSPPGCRKIILTTNIAETSVTVPDVKFVVDTGKLREKRYDQVKRISALETVWESNSNARQRAGRAGRVSDGNYYALYSKKRRETMPASGLPELLRSDLQETCLSIKAQGFRDPVSDFLADAIEPPSSEAVQVAVENLKSIEALTEDEKLTALGRVLARLPVHPTLGNMVLLGIIFRCLDPIIINSCLGSERPLFIDPPTMRAEARKHHAQFAQGNSDHLAFVNAFKTIRTRMRESGMHSAWSYAQDNFLHFGAFRSMEQTTQQILEALRDAGLVKSLIEGEDYQLGGEALNINSNNIALVKSLILAGTYPNLAVHRAKSKSPIHKTITEDKVMMHPSSTNVHKRDSPAEHDQIFAYNSLSRSHAGDSLYMRDTTLVTPLMAILFGGHLQTKTYKTLTMDDWLPFSIKALNNEFAVRLLLEFRKAKDRMLFGVYNDLSDLNKRQRGLLEDPAREIFANGLVDVLKSVDADEKILQGMKRKEGDLFRKFAIRPRQELTKAEKNVVRRGRFEGGSGDVRKLLSN
ncbi:hypothetical protein CBER1_03191 [Cercospora berteroae]|uniref:RNA helicase n=1 Tax=Cercospora berteroae TaxID=357750 RepID=A0A2S6CLE3_9PEZI|nr:hypothetical protein CBER1_03191 [Cercospora berteroae]